MKRISVIAAFALLLCLAPAHAQAQKKSRFRSGLEVRNSSTRAKQSVRSRRSSGRPPTVIRRGDGNIVREDGKMVLYKKRNVVDFDDALIEGEVKNPSEFYFVHRPEEKFGSLVKKRKNFHKEMLRDTVMIR